MGEGKSHSDSNFLPIALLNGGFFMERKDRFNIRKMVTLSLFCALAYAVTFVFRIKVGFLTFDAKDAVVCIAAMIFGPLSGVVISFVVATIEALSVSDTAFWGWLMNFVSTATFSGIAGLIYSKKRTFWGSILGIGASAVTTVAVMMVANLLVTPIFQKTTVEVVWAMIPTVLLPFNAIKTVLNSSIVLILYKPLTGALRKAKLLPRIERTQSDKPYIMRLRSIILLAVSLALVVGSILIVIFVMDGSFVKK
jgi:riboflavin transporter FmnP